MVSGMPNISVKRLIKKAVASPAPCHSLGFRGRVKKKKESRITAVLTTTVGQFPYHSSKDMLDGDLVTALPQLKRNEPTVRITTTVQILFRWLIMPSKYFADTGHRDPFQASCCKFCSYQPQAVHRPQARS